MRRLIAAITVIAFCWAASAAPLLTAYRTDTPPAIDGRADDTCWETANVTSPFLRSDTSRMPDEQTHVRVCYDNEHIYVMAEAFEAYLDPVLNMLHRVKAEESGEDARVFSDDCVEVFLQPPGGDYYHFAANSGDGTYDARSQDSSWDSQWQCTSRRTEESYIVEMAIPFADLQGSAEGVWMANFCRERTAIEEPSTWCGLRGGFHQPGEFGQLRFAHSGPRLGAVGVEKTGPSVAFNATVAGERTAETRFSARLQSDGETIEDTAAGGGKHTVELAIPPAAFDHLQVHAEYSLLDGGELVVQSAQIPVSIGAGRAELSVESRDCEATAYLNGSALDESEWEHISLHPGLNLLAFEAEPTGEEPRISPVVKSQDGNLIRRWLLCGGGEGWNEALPETTEYAGLQPEELSWPDDSSRTVRLMAGVYVPAAGPQLFPKLNTYHFPAGSRQLIRLYVHAPLDVPERGYSMMAQIPEILQYQAVEAVSGGSPTVSRVQNPGGRLEDTALYRINYDRIPHQGFQLEIRWGFRDDSHTYEPVITTGGTHDWKRLSTTVTAPKDVVDARLIIIKRGKRGITGTFWADNVRMKEKGSEKSLVEHGNFDDETWKNTPEVTDEGRNGTRGVKFVSESSNADEQQGMWPTEPQDSIAVSPGQQFEVAMDAKCEKVGVTHGHPVVGLLFSAPADAEPSEYTMSTYFQTLDGAIAEIPQDSRLKVLPPMKNVQPSTARISVSYPAPRFADPDVAEAYADNCHKSGIMYIFGHFSSNIIPRLHEMGHKIMLGTHWQVGAPPEGWSDYLKEHKELQAVDFNGNAMDRVFCPTWLLAEGGVVVEGLREELVQRINADPYAGVYWDLEQAVIDPPTYCTCDRCMAAFREFADIPEDAELTPDILLEEYPHQWTEFRCLQNAQFAEHIRNIVKSADRPVEFSMYSGYQSQRTRRHYGVDWSLLDPVIDLGMGGYGFNHGQIVDTVGALENTPFKGGEMWYLHYRNDARPAPKMEIWCNRLLRQYIFSGCVGCHIWRLSAMDGGSFYKTSRATAYMEQYAEYFKHEQRCDEKVQVEGIKRGNWAAFEHAGRILVVLMSFRGESTTAKVTVEGTTHTRTIEPYGTAIFVAQ